VESAQFNKFVPGKCVFINPAYANKDEGSIPLLTRISLPKADEEADDWCRSVWNKVQKRLIQNSKQKVFSEDLSRQEIAKRMAIAEEFFPLPEDPKKTSPAGKKKVTL
jgi:hypothetical protein